MHAVGWRQDTAGFWIIGDTESAALNRIREKALPRQQPCAESDTAAIGRDAAEEAL